MSTDPLTEARTIVLNLTNKQTKEASNLQVDDENATYTLNLKTPIDVPQIAKPQIGLYNANIANTFKNIAVRFQNTKIRFHAGLMRVYDPRQRPNPLFPAENKNDSFGPQYFGSVVDYCEYGNANQSSIFTGDLEFGGEFTDYRKNYDYPDDITIEIPDGNYILSDIEREINKQLVAKTKKTDKGTWFHYFDVAAKSLAGQQYATPPDRGHQPFTGVVFVDPEQGQEGDQWYQPCLGVANPRIDDEYGSTSADIQDPALTFEELQILCDPDVQDEDAESDQHKRIPRLYARHIKGVNLKYNSIKNRIEIITVGNASVLVEGTQDLTDPSKVNKDGPIVSTLATKALGFDDTVLAHTNPSSKHYLISIDYSKFTPTLSLTDEASLTSVFARFERHKIPGFHDPLVEPLLNNFVGYILRSSETTDFRGKILRHGVGHYYIEVTQGTIPEPEVGGVTKYLRLYEPDGTTPVTSGTYANDWTFPFKTKRVPQYVDLAAPIKPLRAAGFPVVNATGVTSMTPVVQIDHVMFRFPQAMGNIDDRWRHATRRLGFDGVGADAHRLLHEYSSGTTTPIAPAQGLVGADNEKLNYIVGMGDSIINPTAYTQAGNQLVLNKYMPTNILTQTITAVQVGSIQQVRTLHVNVPGLVEASYDHNGERSAYQLATIPLTVAPGAIEAYQVDAPMFLPCTQNLQIDSINFTITDQDDEPIDMQGGRFELSVVIRWDAWSGDPLMLAPTSEVRSLAFQQDLTAAQGAVPMLPRRPLQS